MPSRSLFGPKRVPKKSTVRKTGRPINSGYQLTCTVMADENVKLALAIAEKGKYAGWGFYCLNFTQ